MRTFNPITGCKQGCEFCYAEDFTKRFPKIFPHGFEPTFYPERVKAPCYEKNPMSIFTVSMGEFFGPWVPYAWQKPIMDTIGTCNWHQFQILTKQPDHIWHRKVMPSNLWLGVSVNYIRDIKRIDSLRDPQINHAGVRFISFEPLFEDMASVNLDGIDWIIIGAQTNPLKLPEKEWVTGLISLAREYGTQVFLKKSLDSMFPKTRATRQYPTEPKVPSLFRDQIWKKLKI